MLDKTLVLSEDRNESARLDTVRLQQQRMQQAVALVLWPGS